MERRVQAALDKQEMLGLLAMPECTFSAIADSTARGDLTTLDQPGGYSSIADISMAGRISAVFAGRHPTRHPMLPPPDVI
jgi:hypothetical protein